MSSKESTIGECITMDEASVTTISGEALEKLKPRDLVNLILTANGELGAALNPHLFDDPVLMELAAQCLINTGEYLIKSIKEVHPQYEVGQPWDEAVKLGTGLVKLRKRVDAGSSETGDSGTAGLSGLDECGPTPES